MSVPWGRIHTVYPRCMRTIQFYQEGMFRYRGVHSHARNLLVVSQPCSMKFLEEVGSADERGTRRKKKQALFFSGNRGTRRKNRPYFLVETAEYMLTSVGYQGTVMVPEARWWQSLQEASGRTQEGYRGCCGRKRKTNSKIGLQVMWVEDRLVKWQ